MNFEHIHGILLWTNIKRIYPISIQIEFQANKMNQQMQKFQIYFISRNLLTELVPTTPKSENKIKIERSRILKLNPN